jgi:GR25 family glycosyltransferase involved in LPS biosynthesis
MTANQWVTSIGQIFVINLLKRNDRRHQIEQELSKYNIPFLLWTAIEDENGAEGLRQTMVELFESCLKNGYQRVLIFEDDAVMIEDINKYMPLCLEQLPEDFDLFYLGCQHNQKFERFHSENILPVFSAFSTHAVLWSESGMKKFLERCNGLPIDREIRNKIQGDDKCYVSYPMLVSQRPSFSDIDGCVRDWSKWLEQLYYKNINHLINGGV